MAENDKKKKEEENHNTIAYNCYYQRMCVLLAHSLPASQHDIWNWSSNQFLWSVDESFVWFSYLLLLFCVFVSVPSCSYLLFTKRCGFVLVFLVGLFFMCVFFYLVCCMLDRANLSAFLIADINHTHDQQQLILLLCAYRIKKKKNEKFSHHLSELIAIRLWDAKLDQRWDGGDIIRCVIFFFCQSIQI